MLDDNSRAEEVATGGYIQLTGWQARQAGKAGQADKAAVRGDKVCVV